MKICQILNPYDIRELLPCKEYESGGVQCEVLEPHIIHKISQHTIQHSLNGNGYSCEGFEEQDHPDV